jgi:hypothetical protein
VRPVVKYVGDLNMLGDAEGKVHVGEAVARVHGERAHDGSGDDALILPPEPENALEESIPLLDAEHVLRC